MVHRVLGDDALRFVIVISARVQITIEAREVAAGNFDPDPVPRGEIIAGRHRLEFHFVNLVRLHPDKRFIVPFAITHPLDGFVQIKRPSLLVDVDQFHGKIRVAGVR